MANAIISTTTVLAAKKRRIFLRVLSECGSVLEAAKACGYTSSSYMQKYRAEHEDFAEEWAHAVDAAADRLENEADRRAVEGVSEPIMYKGAVVGFKQNYSDALLMFRLRGLRPDMYRENARGGDVNVNFGIAVIPVTAKSDEAWEQRALNMHDNQKVLRLEDKPVENNMTRVRRGD